MSSYEYFYPSTPYSLEPTYGGFIGYKVPVGELGAPTKIDTAAQIVEVSNLLNQGFKQIEVQPLSPEVFDQIPKQHFKEINRLTKLTGAETSIHAPMIEPSGFTKEGWSESSREIAERELKSVIEKSHELSPAGKIPVTIHASGIPGTEYSKPSKQLVENYKKQFIRDIGREPTEQELAKLNESRIIAINQETKQLIPIPIEERYYPEEGYVIKTPENEIQVINNTEWINNLTNLAYYQKHADEIMGESIPALQAMHEKSISGEKVERMTAQEKSAVEQLKRAYLFLNNIEASFRSMYDKAYKYSNEEERKKLETIGEEWRKQQENIGKLQLRAAKGDSAAYAEMIIEKSKLLNEAINGSAENRVIGLENIRAPQVYQPIEKFAVKQSAETLSNAAVSAFEKFGEKMPIISIENLYSGMAFSKSEDLKKLVEESRNKFAEKLHNKGYGKREAEEIAKKTIGVTWDVGHLNMLRKGGYTEKELIEESKKIAPFVKHVHITDNFGFSDAHLPPGMGNVPIKEILEKLEKAGFEGKKIVEAGGFVQHFRTSPFPYVLEAFGSPLYPMHAQPTWNQMASTYGGYFAMPSAYLPEQHFSIYGGGFSGLPSELGGQMPGKQSRFSGTPTE